MATGFARAVGHLIDRYPRAAGIAFLCCSIAVAGILAFVGRDGLASSHWPVAKGIVTRASVTTRLREGRLEQHWDFAYTYAVNKQWFESDQISGGAFSSTVEALEKRIGPIQVGSPVTVHYDPGRPRDAVLLTGLTAHDVVGFLALIALPAALGWVCIHAARTRREAMTAAVAPDSAAA